VSAHVPHVQSLDLPYCIDAVSVDVLEAVCTLHAFCCATCCHYLTLLLILHSLLQKYVCVCVFVCVCVCVKCNCHTHLSKMAYTNARTAITTCRSRYIVPLGFSLINCGEWKISACVGFFVVMPVGLPAHEYGSVPCCMTSFLHSHLHPLHLAPAPACTCNCNCTRAAQCATYESRMCCSMSLLFGVYASPSDTSNQQSGL
jgi:hypothetical protein